MMMDQIMNTGRVKGKRKRKAMSATAMVSLFSSLLVLCLSRCSEQREEGNITFITQRGHLRVLKETRAGSAFCFTVRESGVAAGSTGTGTLFFIVTRQDY
jgi:hypothetical protein